MTNTQSTQAPDQIGTVLGLPLNGSDLVNGTLTTQDVGAAQILKYMCDTTEMIETAAAAFKMLKGVMHVLYNTRATTLLTIMAFAVIRLFFPDSFRNYLAVWVNVGLLIICLPPMVGLLIKRIKGSPKSRHSDR
jgi:hypothetical protein